ncbi:hypothetical protein H5410_060324 [Solanum commersonii]|uniref:Uncharacterized protein n=1 Tax=Solanum commersonii TaxID=4109 RepID=A0A9J5W679_SOLCO|nr:hypothetical protein H5410_060324 [Solanum commersonii]
MMTTCLMLATMTNKSPKGMMCVIITTKLSQFVYRRRMKMVLPLMRQDMEMLENTSTIVVPQLLGCRDLLGIIPANHTGDVNRTRQALCDMLDSEGIEGGSISGHPYG